MENVILTAFDCGFLGIEKIWFTFRGAHGLVSLVPLILAPVGSAKTHLHPIFKDKFGSKKEAQFLLQIGIEKLCVVAVAHERALRSDSCVASQPVSSSGRAAEYITAVMHTQSLLHAQCSSQVVFALFQWGGAAAERPVWFALYRLTTAVLLPLWVCSDLMLETSTYFQGTAGACTALRQSNQSEQ